MCRIWAASCSMAGRWTILPGGGAPSGGVAVMHQHPGLFGDLAVYENIFMGHVPRTALGTIDDRRMREEARELT